MYLAKVGCALDAISLFSRNRWSPVSGQKEWSRVRVTQTQQPDCQPPSTRLSHREKAAMVETLIERLRFADINSQQRVLGSRIFCEAADRLEALEREKEELRKELERTKLHASAWEDSARLNKDRAETAERQLAERDAALRAIMDQDHISANERIYGPCGEIARAALAGSGSGGRP
jgi:hypothetical protein